MALSLNMRQQLRISLLIFLMSVCAQCLCITSESTLNTVRSWEYEAMVRLWQETGRTFELWPGVIINDRYILSCDIGGAKVENVTIRVGFVRIGDLIEFSSSNRFSSKNAENSYKIENYWRFESLSLIRTKNKILFTNKVRNIDLPKGKELNAWKNPNNIPNNKDFITSYWCRPISENDYALKIITGERKCARDVCYRYSNTFSSCMTILSHDQICRLVPGAPLVLNNTLVGIRKNWHGLKPNSELKASDNYINIAVHVELIEKLMEVDINFHN